MVAALALEVVMRQAAQFSVDQRHQLLESLMVSLSPAK
jgi:hypothetical protein